MSQWKLFKDDSPHVGDVYWAQCMRAMSTPMVPMHADSYSSCTTVSWKTCTYVLVSRSIRCLKARLHFCEVYSCEIASNFRIMEPKNRQEKKPISCICGNEIFQRRQQIQKRKAFRRSQFTCACMTIMSWHLRWYCWNICLKFETRHSANVAQHWNPPISATLNFQCSSCGSSFIYWIPINYI